jgi:adenylylsulfate kinase
MTDARKATNVTWDGGNLTREQRWERLGCSGATLWFTGLSGSGKSTVAAALEVALLERGVFTYRLDGDNLRHGLNANLGFSAEDRQENIRRVGEVAKLFADAGVLTLATFVSPYRSDRALCRRLHDAAGLPFVEIHVAASLEVCEARDPKGLYRKARAGQIQGFTGIDDPYEAPESPELVIDTGQLTVDACVERIVALLEARALVAVSAE